MKRMEMAPTTLTDLPERAIHEILCRLEIVEAVRTCVLSRAWRRRWQSIPDLDLRGLINPIASQILLLHSGDIRLLKAETNGDHSTVYSWLAGLSVRTAGSSLRTLHLFGLDCHLLSIACYFPNLTDLRLAGGTQYLPRDFSGFKALQTLHLVDATFHGNLSMLIYACPLLEAFSLVNINLVERQRLDIFAPNLRLFEMMNVDNLDELAITSDGDLFGLKNLRMLHFECIPFHGNLSMLFSACPLLEEATLLTVRLEEKQCLDIIALNLRFLKIVNVKYLNDFSITNAPVLEVAVLDCLIDGDGDHQIGTIGDCKVVKVLGGMPKVKKLNLSNGTLKYLVDGNIQGRLPFSFKHLTFLSLEVNFDCELEALLTLCLFRSSPYLEEFEYKGLSYSEGIGAGLDFWKAQDHLSVFDKLKIVNMIDIMGIKAEFDFIEFVTAKAELLKKIMVSKCLQ